MIRDAGLDLVQVQTHAIDQRLTLRRALRKGRLKLYLANLTMATWFGRAVKP